jgi:hypothetical protein
VGVDIDEAGSDEEAGGIERAARRALDAANRDNATVFDRYVARECRPSGPIDDGAGTDHQVIHGSLALTRAETCFEYARL